MRIESSGFLDLQVNGFAGVDFNNPDCTPEQLQHATDRLRATGVTRYLPTLVTSTLERFARCAQALFNFAHPAIAGIHLEGPYISPEDGARGAHPREHIVHASIEDFERRQEAARGCIKLVTLAPEVPSALRLIEHLVASDVRVAIGHTSASPTQIQAATKAGASMSTHLGNGCALMLPRHPNFIWEQLAADELCASLIVDGHHLPAATVKSIVRAKTPAGTILVTDAMAAAGCAPGSYMIGELAVELSADGRVAEPDATYLAGSALSMDAAVANTVRFTGLSLEEVLPMASMQPAHYLRLEPAGRVIADWDQAAHRLSVVQVVDEVD
jgi:N-acetylglucosamine-6-phosphate deacetylase